MAACGLCGHDDCTLFGNSAGVLPKTETLSRLEESVREGPFQSKFGLRLNSNIRNSGAYVEIGPIYISMQSLKYDFGSIPEDLGYVKVHNIDKKTLEN